MSVLMVQRQARRRNLGAALCLPVLQPCGENRREQRGAARGGEAPGAEHDTRKEHGLSVVVAEKGWEPWTKMRKVSWSAGCCSGKLDLVHWL